MCAKQATAQPPKAVADASEEKRARNRSPAYPAFGLKEAIDKLRLFYQRNAFNPAAAHLAIGDLDYKATSSSGLRALAALLHFGLLQETGSGKQRKVSISPRGKVILLAPDERADEREKAIREAALTPKLYRRLWEKYGPNLPSNKNLEYDLSLEEEFNPDVISGLIKDFVATVQFAKLAESGTLDPDPENGANGGESDRARENPPPPPGMPQGGKPMPAVTGATWDFQIPLMGGQQAFLRVPLPLSEANRKLLVGLVTSNIEALKDALAGTSSESDT